MVIIYLIFMLYINHRMQRTQERSEYDLMTCNKWVHYCQKVPVVFVTNTYCSPPTWQIVQKLKQVLKRSYLVQTQARRRLRHLLVHASSMTVCCSSFYTSIIHCFNWQTSLILVWALLHCFPDFIVMGFRP